MRVFAFLIAMVFSTMAVAAPKQNIVLTPPQYQKITKALVKCKAIKKKCKVDIATEKKECNRLRERDKVLCKASKPMYVWPLVVVGVSGLVVGASVGLLVGVGIGR